MEPRSKTLSLEMIQDMWEKDAKMNQDELDTESLESHNYTLLIMNYIIQYCSCESVKSRHIVMFY